MSTAERVDTFARMLNVRASDADLVALYYNDTPMTYAQLRDEARRMAKGLLALGVRRGDRVAAVFANQPEWLTMFCATSYLGAALVPLNTWYKEREIAYVLRHCGVSVLVSLPSLLKQDFASMYRAVIPELHGAALGGLHAQGFPDLHSVAFAGEVSGVSTWSDLCRIGDGIPDSELDATSGVVEGSDVALLLYTSAAPADPKGVLLCHGNLLANGYEIGTRRTIDEHDRIWLGSPLFYTLGSGNALPVAFSHGASLVLQDTFDAEHTIATIAATQASVYYGSGNMTQAMLAHPTYERSKIASLQKGLAGLSAEYKRLTLVEMEITQATPSYGMTESYGHSTGGWPDDDLDVKLATDGEVLPGVEMVIVDPQTYEPLGVNERGLVLFRGRITPGYYRSDAETNRALRPDGFFDTGDLGSLDEAGRFTFAARLKEIIKSGGVNVSPAEVEHLIVSHPSVIDAFVVGVLDPTTSSERVVAFVVARDALEERTVREHVRENAASFKVPHHVIFRSEEELPRVASGKVAKHRLVDEARGELGLETL